MYTMETYQIKCELIERLIDYLPSAIIVLNTDTSIVLANTMAEQFSQQSRMDIFGRRGGDVFGCIHAHDVPEGCGYGRACQKCMVRNTVEKTLISKENFMNVEAPMSFTDMGDRTLAVSTTWLSKHQLVVVALNDITELKHQEMLRIENSRLQAAIKTGGAVCHEMNQPLFVIKGNIELMQMDDAVPPKFHESLGTLQAQVERMTVITKKLMHISRFSEKKYLNDTILDLELST